jgi:hypothetical protein
MARLALAPGSPAFDLKVVEERQYPLVQRESLTGS